MKPKAVALLSGGLDSVLAVRMLMDQGVEVTGLNIRLPFVRKSAESPEAAADWLGIHLATVTVGDDYIELLRHPRFGYGKALNPCIDCRIYMLGAARRIMAETGAEFVITGDVLRQRAKSQRPDALHIEDRCSGLEGLVVRPLSALLLPPTLPEQTGVVARSLLLGLSGRTRRTQFEMAGRFGLEHFSTPAGGCPLTDREFAQRVRALLVHVPAATARDLTLVSRGRHFYLGESYFIVGRSQRENRVLSEACAPDDAIVRITECGGPATLVRGRVDMAALVRAAQLTAVYSDAPADAAVRVEYCAPWGSGTLALEQGAVPASALPACRRSSCVAPPSPQAS